MSKENMKIDDEKDTRRVKQVYVSDTEDARETAAEKRRFENNAEMYRAAHRESSGGHVIRGIAIAFAMFFSLLLAMTVGVGLALWDSNRTVADLQAILLGQTVAAATSDMTENAAASGKSGDEPGSGKNNDTVAAADDKKDSGTSEDEAATDETQTDEEAVDETSEDEPEGDAENEEPAGEPEEGLDAEAEWDEPSGYGSTIISDEEGSENVEKAGSNDEISKDEEEEDTEDTDPTRDYPLPFTTVDESYFTDALFIGDSRLQGFGFWSGLPATYYCATGFQLYKYDTTKVVQTENGKVPIFDALPYDAFTKIYIKVGLNELGYGTEENFEKYYAQLIAKLREYEPRAIIYVHGLLPVTAQKSATDKAHNNPNIIIRNKALQKFAESEKAYYLDAGPVLSDADGSLKAEMTTDGIHLSAPYMKIWREYLCEHAVVIK